MTEKLISRAKKQQMDQLKKTKFILTDFHSGHIASIMILYSHLRKWKRKDLRQMYAPASENSDNWLLIPLFCLPFAYSAFSLRDRALFFAHHPPARD